MSLPGISHGLYEVCEIDAYVLNVLDLLSLPGISHGLYGVCEIDAYVLNVLDLLSLPGISHGLYGVCEIDAYARKCEEGYFVDPQLIAHSLENLKKWVLTKGEHQVLTEVKMRE